MGRWIGEAETEGYHRWPGNPSVSSCGTATSPFVQEEKWRGSERDLPPHPNPKIASIDCKLGRGYRDLMLRFKIFVFGFILLSAGSTSARTLAPTTPEREAARVQRADGARYSHELYGQTKKWNFVSRQIASGGKAWLKVAVLLARHADGAFAEELSTDFALALLKNPREVLQLAKAPSAPQQVNLRIVCSAPIPTPGKAWLRGYVRRTIVAVEAIHDSRLKNAKTQCLRVLRSVDLSRPAEEYI